MRPNSCLGTERTTTKNNLDDQSKWKKRTVLADLLSGVNSASRKKDAKQVTSSSDAHRTLLSHIKKFSNFLLLLFPLLVCITSLYFFLLSFVDSCPHLPIPPLMFFWRETRLTRDFLSIKNHEYLLSETWPLTKITLVSFHKFLFPFLFNILFIFYKN